MIISFEAEVYPTLLASKPLKAGIPIDAVPKRVVIPAKAGIQSKMMCEALDVEF